MSSLDTGAAFDRLAARLLAQARALAAVRRLGRRGDARRWREARLLWPLFGRG